MYSEQHDDYIRFLIKDKNIVELKRHRRITIAQRSKVELLLNSTSDPREVEEFKDQVVMCKAIQESVNNALRILEPCI